MKGGGRELSSRVRVRQGAPKDPTARDTAHWDRPMRQVRKRKSISLNLVECNVASTRITYGRVTARPSTHTKRTSLTAAPPLPNPSTLVTSSLQIRSPSQDARREERLRLCGAINGAGGVWLRGAMAGVEATVFPGEDGPTTLAPRTLRLARATRFQVAWG